MVTSGLTTRVLSKLVYRGLVSGGILPDGIEHEDLWQQVELEISHCGCNLWLHKTPSHTDQDSCHSELESWRAYYNDRTDTAARWTNANRPNWFAGVYQRFAARWHADDEIFRQISKVHSEVARIDLSSCREGKPNSEPVEEFVVSRERTDCIETFTLAACDRIPGWIDLPGHRSRHSEALFDFIC